MAPAPIMRAHAPPEHAPLLHSSAGREAKGTGLRRALAGDRSFGGICRLGKRSEQVIELMAGARRLGGEIAPVVGIDRAMQRDAAAHLNASLGETVELGRIVGQKLHALDAEDL